MPSIRFFYAWMINGSLCGLMGEKIKTTFLWNLSGAGTKLKKEPKMRETKIIQEALRTIPLEPIKIKECLALRKQNKKNGSSGSKPHTLYVICI